ncbi:MULTISPECIES: hypothetical protein [Streptomyces]|uniref:Lipoprotein n=2 Tax=Streptomyces TaxID=1883 RepID=A0A100Y370_9ACTN|nr:MULTISPECIES: hypothetical protein [Streptomyces]KUH36837.1 hypothetical protein ATE80_21555 [Streptomyces kanasensis]UUS34148.1 hypothetical protein NRO40_27175 [Streptomyces changanensis]
MRAIGAASAALLGAAALALTAPPAAAVDPYVVSPSTVNPGGRVVLSAPGCAGTAIASSGIFDAVSIPAGGSATATVDWDARRGAAYTVSFTCAGGAPGTARLRVAAGTTSSTAAPTVTRTATVTPAPSGVRGGLGGSVGGWNAGELAAGTGLVVAAATGVVYALRRRAESRRH